MPRLSSVGCASKTRCNSARRGLRGGDTSGSGPGRAGAEEVNTKQATRVIDNARMAVSGVCRVTHARCGGKLPLLGARHGGARRVGRTTRIVGGGGLAGLRVLSTPRDGRSVDPADFAVDHSVQGVLRSGQAVQHSVRRRTSLTELPLKLCSELNIFSRKPFFLKPINKTLETSKTPAAFFGHHQKKRGVRLSPIRLSVVDIFRSHRPGHGVHRCTLLITLSSSATIAIRLP